MPFGPYFVKSRQMVFLWKKVGLLHMCFDRFLLAVESRDLSQADKSVIRVSSIFQFYKTSIFEQ